MATKARSTTTKMKQGSKKESTTGATRRTGNGTAGKHMVENLEEGFLAELADMLHAERELLKTLPRLAQAATSRRLRETLEMHAEQTEEQVMRLEHVFRIFGRKPQAETCEGMQGILEECKDLLQKTGPGPVRDAMIIAATQKAEHYEIAAYGTLCSWAEQLDEREAVNLLEDTLREEKLADRNLSRIAESFANPQAERGQGRDPDRAYGYGGGGRSGEYGEGPRSGFGSSGRYEESGSRGGRYAESPRTRDRDPRFDDRPRGGRGDRERRSND
jgi:ferritin-like metal-binding protein YciE